MNNRTLLGLSFLLVAAGFLVPFWPLSLLGIAVAAGIGSWFAAILFGLLLDVAYGPPAGLLHMLYIPFALFALFCSIARAVISAQLRKGSQDRLY